MDFIPISALEHASYCARQCALIHVESVWDENVFTLKGTRAHERADTAMTRQEHGVTIIRALPVWNDALGIVGRCDVVEADRVPCAPMPAGSMRPVEYKSGRRTTATHAHVQAAAQALCLEEMFATTVTEIVVYYGASRQRATVSLDEAVRALTLRLIDDTRRLLLSETLPPPVADQRCRNCSLIDVCEPFALKSAAMAAHGELFRPRAEGDWT